MSYLIFCTFDLKNASAADYANAYADLQKIGLTKVAVHNNGSNVVIPTTSVIGTFNGAGVSEICVFVRDQVINTFKARGFHSEVFIMGGGDWAWIAGSS